MNYHKLKNKILFMLFLLTFFVLTLILLLQYKIEQNTIKDMVQIEKTKLVSIYNHSTKNFYLMYTSLGKELISNKEVALAVKNKDKDKLLKLTKEFYKEQKQQNPYFHNMHFHTTNAISLLRVHKPEKNGDDLNASRPMVVAVNKEKKILQGIEVGKHAISFRVAFPIFYENEHVGSLELGVKVSYLTNLLKNSFNTNSFFVFHNKILTHLFKHSKNKIEHKTIKHITLFNYQDCDLPEKMSFDQLDEILHENNIFKIGNTNNYLAEISKFTNYNNEPVGHIVFLIDMNPFMNKIYLYRTAILISLLFFVITLFYMLNRWFGFFVKEVESNQKKLETLSQIDELTQLYNRRKILDLLDCEYDRSKRYEISDTIIILDIDHFKKINDSFGHNIGDMVLKELSSLLKQNVRKTDHIGRWGGEEFIILATQTNIDNTYKFTEKIRSIIENHKFPDITKVTCSFGIAKLDTTANYKDSINKADQALYQAKKAGRNKVIIFRT